MKRALLLLFLLLVVLSAQAQVSVTLVPDPKVQWLDLNGDPLASGHVHTYISGTTTDQATYTDSGGGTPNANPVVLDSAGRAEIWLDDSLVYTIALHDSSDALVWSVDGVSAGDLETALVIGTTAVTFTSTPTFDSSTASYFSITLTGNVTSSTISNASDGRIIYFNICQDATGGRTFTWPASVLTAPTIGSGVSVCTSASFIYDGTNWREQAPSSRGSSVFDTSTIGVLNNVHVVDGNKYAQTEAGINAAIAAAQTDASAVYIPAGSYTTTDEFDIDCTASNPIIVFGDGPQQTIIEQTTWGQAVFEIRDCVGVQIKDIGFLNTQAKVVISGTYDGEPARAFSAGVYVADSDKTVIENIECIDLSNCVTWRGDTVSTSGLDEDNVLRWMKAHGVDQGILAQQQRGCIVSDLIGEDIEVVQTGNPSHLIYFTAGTSIVDQESCSGSNFTDRDNLGGAAYKFVDVKGFQFTTMGGIGGESAFDLEANESTFSGGTFLDYTPDTSRGLFNITNTTRTTLADFYASTTDDFDQDGLRVHTTGNSDIRIINFHIKCDYSSGASGKACFRINQGARIQIINPTCEQADADKACFFVEAGTLNLISNPVFLGSVTSPRFFSLTGGTTRISMLSDEINQADLPSANLLDASAMFCADCTIANVCVASGNGSFAKRLNSAWNCGGGVTIANPLEGTLSNEPRWILKVVDFGDMTAAATADDFVLWTLPANTMIGDVVGTVVTGWSGGSISAAVCSVGTAGGSANDLTLDDNFFAAATVYELHDATASGGKGTLLYDATDKFAPYMQVASGDIEIQCDLTGDNHVNATAGQARIYILVSQPLTSNTTTEAN